MELSDENALKILDSINWNDTNDDDRNIIGDDDNHDTYNVNNNVTGENMISIKTNIENNNSNSNSNSNSNEIRTNSDSGCNSSNRNSNRNTITETMTNDKLMVVNDILNSVRNEKLNNTNPNKTLIFRDKYVSFQIDIETLVKWNNDITDDNDNNNSNHINRNE